MIYFILLFWLLCDFLVSCFVMFRVDLFVSVVEVHTLNLDACVCIKERLFLII